jgi:hypothetical protein
MDQRAIEYCSVIPTNESLAEFGSIDRRERIHPSIFLSKTHRGKSERPFCSELEAKTRACQWALNRLAVWRLRDVPGDAVKFVKYGRFAFRPNSRSNIPS